MTATLLCVTGRRKARDAVLQLLKEAGYEVHEEPGLVGVDRLNRAGSRGPVLFATELPDPAAFAAGKRADEQPAVPRLRVRWELPGERDERVIVHDLNNVFTVIQNSAHVLLRSTGTNRPDRRALRAIQSAAECGVKLVAELDAMNRQHDGKPPR